MKSRGRRILITLIKLGFAALIIAWAWHKKLLDPTSIMAQLKNADYMLIIYGLAVLQVAAIVGWLRWWVIVRAEGFELGLHEAFSLTMIGAFFNMFLMGAVGGDVIKAYYIATGEGSSRKAVAITTVVMDRVFGMLGLVVMFFLALLLVGGRIFGNPELSKFAITISIAYAAGILGLLYLVIPFFRNQRKRQLQKAIDSGSKLQKFWEALDSIDDALSIGTRAPRASLAALMLSVLGHISAIVAFMLFGYAFGFGGKLSFADYMVLVPMALAITNIPIFPGGGIGVGESASAAVFAATNLTCGAVMLLLWRTARYVPAPLGLIYFVIHRERITEIQEAARPDDESRE